LKDRWLQARLRSALDFLQVDMKSIPKCGGKVR
jgi:hypothetical protein